MPDGATTQTIDTKARTGRSDRPGWTLGRGGTGTRFETIPMRGDPMTDAAPAAPCAPPISLTAIDRDFEQAVLDRLLAAASARRQRAASSEGGASGG